MSICFDRRIPSLLEYFGYMFHHSTLLAGPVCTFNDFMDFIEGRDIASATDQVRKKILATVYRFLLLTKLLYRGNLSHNLDILLYYLIHTLLRTIETPSTPLITICPLPPSPKNPSTPPWSKMVSRFCFVLACFHWCISILIIILTSRFCSLKGQTND